VADLRAIREGLAANLAAIEDVQVLAYGKSNPTPPTLMITPDDPVVDFDHSGSRGSDRYHLVIDAAVAFASDQGAQHKLDAYLSGNGGRSVKAAAESDPTLGGAADDVRVVEGRAYNTYVSEGRGPVLACRFSVLVIAEGT
jgi:hypothetical protein